MAFISEGTIFLTLVVGVFSYYFWQWTFWKRRGIPGPWGFPILGKSVEMLDDKVPPGKTLQKWTKEYGKVYGITEGVQKVMVVSDPDLVQELFVKQYDNFYGKKINPIQGDPDADKDVHVAEARGFRWKRLRTITAPAFTNNSVKKVLGTIEDSAQEFVKHLETAGGHGESVDMHLFFQEFTLDVISRISMGQPESRMFKNEILYDLKQFFEHNRWQIWMLGSAFPFAVNAIKILFFKLGAFGAGPFIKVNKVISDTVYSRIAQRESDAKNGVEPGEPQDFIDMFLDAKADDIEHFGETNDEFHKSTVYNNRQLTTGEIITQAFLFLVGGFDTTANSLAYVSYFLSLNPDIQRKLQEEVDRECPDAEITFDQLSKLKYMENVIKEALRLMPLGSFANARRCMRTTKLGEHTVEAGVDVMVDTWTLHYDENIWGRDAAEFKPERWDYPLNPHQLFLSFGAGPRQCLGMRLAYLEQKMVLAQVLRKYSFTTNRDTQVPLKLVGRTTTRPDKLMLSVKSRF